MDNLNVELNNQQEKAKKFVFSPKIIFVILGIILLAEIVYAVRVLTTPTSIPLPVAKTDIQKAVGKISLNTPKTNFSIKEAVPVSVMVDTGGYTISGVDLIVHFDPKILEATSGALVKGKIFDEYPLVSLDAKNGLISISGISGVQSGFKGSGQFATINLRTKSLGKTSLIIDFQKGSTTDSNLVEATTSKDILEQAGSINLEVR